MSTESPTGSHPAIRFEQVPVVEGPLSSLNENRAKILTDVSKITLSEFDKSSVELSLGQALYSERIRLKRDRGNIFTRGRLKEDRKLWSHVQSGLLRPVAEVDRQELMERVVAHYAEEIGGRFDPAVYRFATRAVPWGFSWLLNAASVKRFLPWGMTQSLESRLHILGEVPSLQKLSQKGTILLVPTHQSNIDSMLIGYLVYLMSTPPMAYGAGLNLFSNPFFSYFMRRLGTYTVDRQKSNEIYKHTLKNYSTRILREGVHSIFFPGGGRSRSGAIESKLKLGLLGTALEAQIENLKAGSPKPRIFVVPLVMSYHFVLEASTLIEDYLAEAGKHRFIITDDESWQPTKVLHFFWKIFSSRAGITARVGRPLDVFGNFVDDDGEALGPNGTHIDPVRWLTTRGELRAEPQRDREYTLELGRKIAERFHRENTVLTSHLVAFSLFETLRRKYPDLDLYRFLRLSHAQRSMAYSDFLLQAEIHHKHVREAADRGEFYLSEELQTSNVEAWVADGVAQLGLLHESGVAKVRDGVIWTDDLNLLYYYRNRLTGYSLSLLAGTGENMKKSSIFLGQNDRKGFLA